MATEPAQRVLDAFADLTGEARSAVAAALRAEHLHLLIVLGLALEWPETMGVLLLDQALHVAPWDGSAGLLDRLSDVPPWRALRAALAEALKDDGSSIVIASDSP